MTEKDYIVIADTLRGYKYNIYSEFFNELVNTFANNLSRSYSNFNSDKFISYILKD